MNTTPCPDIGTWRAWLDHEDVAEASSKTEHLADCPACKRLVAELRADADSAAAAFALVAPTRLPSAAEVAMARDRLEFRRRPALRSSAGGRRTITTPWRVGAGAIAAAVALSVIVAFTPEGGSVAAAFLAQFRSQQVTAVAITPQSQADIMRTFTALGNLGTISAPGVTNAARPQAAVRAAETPSKVATLADASREVGFTLLTPDPATLPAGLDKTPQIRVMPSSQVRFTFDKKKAQAYFQSSGHPEVSLPDKFDGASLVVSIPAAAVLEYGGGASTKNGLVVGEAGEVVADAQGNVTLPEMRDFLLGLPGLPASVVSQLRQIQNWNDTLPIPVPVDQVHWQSVQVNGNDGLLLNDNSGVVSAAIWHANNHLYGVAGTLKADDLMRVAKSIH